MLAIRNLNSLPNLVGEFFNRDFPYNWSSNWATVSTPAVNIIESNDDYRIELAAPSLKKEDFKVNLENDLLTISANKEETKEDKNESFTRREFSYSSFSRSFTLPETVNGEKISADYKEGILTILVPKHEVAKAKPAREIAIK